MRKEKIFAILALVCARYAQAQDMTGFQLSNYAPATTVFANPASIVNSKTFIDINIFSADAFANSGPLYFPSKYLKPWKLSGVSDLSNPIYFPGKQPNTVYSTFRLQGPSISITSGRNSYAITTSTRLMADARNVPNQLVNFALQGLDYNAQLNEDYQFSHVAVNAQAWSEVGFTFGRLLQRSNHNIYTGAASFHYLIPHAQANVALDDVAFNVKPGQNLTISKLDGNYAYTPSAFKAGSGKGFDLGFMYYHTIDDVSDYVPHSLAHHCVYAEYRYKIGISVTDIGSLTYSQNASERIINGGALHMVDASTIHPNNYHELDSIMTSELKKFNSSIAPRSKYSVKLPTALHVQFDLNLNQNFYLGAEFTKGFNHTNTLGVEHNSSLMVIPRFETQWFEVELPLGFYNFQQMTAGFCVRSGPLFIGSDRLGSLIGSHNINGFSFYAGLKIPLYHRQGCGENPASRIRSHERKRRKMISCPSFKN